VLRKNLYRAKGIIEGMLRTVAALSVHAKEIQDLCDTPESTHDKFMREMANISRDLLSYQSMTEILVNRSADIKSTVCIAISCVRKKHEADLGFVSEQRIDKLHLQVPQSRNAH
jgi:hypothetical protein